MSNSPAKNNILKKIRMALAKPTPLPFPSAEGKHNIFQPQTQDPVVEFAEQFTQLQGKFIYSASKEEEFRQVQNLLAQTEWKAVLADDPSLNIFIPQEIRTQSITECDAAFTRCEFLVARTGSIVLSSMVGGRINSVYAPVHVCFARTSQLVYDLKDGLEGMQRKYGNDLPSMISFAAGPSRTADIEKTLVVGIHGPKEVYCFVTDDQV